MINQIKKVINSDELKLIINKKIKLGIDIFNDVLLNLNNELEYKELNILLTDSVETAIIKIINIKKCQSFIFRHFLENITKNFTCLCYCSLCKYFWLLLKIKSNISYLLENKNKILQILNKKTNIILYFFELKEEDIFYEYRCPIDNHLLLKICNDLIEIKCPKCKQKHVHKIEKDSNKIQ